MYPAHHFILRPDGKISCGLCPHKCIIPNGKYGTCNTRRNDRGRLIAENYGILSAVSMDPIEKKPLYHFLPGHSVLSIGSYGCNLKCLFCQNCDISQVDPDIYSDMTRMEPRSIVENALVKNRNIGIAYTYNEPTVFFEYMMDCARLIRANELKNIVVSNGYINPKPLEELIELSDAFNIDLKSYRNEFYKRNTGSTLEPVLNTIRKISESDCHLEITYLVVPGLNDSEEEWKDLLKWLFDLNGDTIAIHVSRYFPRHQLSTDPTPLKTIESFVDIAGELFSFVYPGNTGGSLNSDTVCPGCGQLLIKRESYRTRISGLSKSGECIFCNQKIYGQFNFN